MQRPLRSAGGKPQCSAVVGGKLGTATRAARTIVGTSAMLLPAARCALLKLRMSAAFWKRAGELAMPSTHQRLEQALQ